MAVVVIVAPAVLVSLDLAKRQLHVEDDGDDALIGAFVAAACAHIDGPGGWLGAAIGPQTLELRAAACDLLGCRSQFTLPFGPATAVTGFAYSDADDAEQTFLAANYRLTSDDVVQLVQGQAWPTTRNGADAVRVRYTAGFAAVPPAIVAAVLLMVGDLYANRESSAAGVVSAVPMSTTVENLLSPFRNWQA